MDKPTDEQVNEAVREMIRADGRLDAALTAYAYHPCDRTMDARDQARASALLAFCDAHILGTRYRQKEPCEALALLEILGRVRSVTADLADRAFGDGWNG